MGLRHPATISRKQISDKCKWRNNLSKVSFTVLVHSTARSREDETRNDQRNANRNPEWWGDFSQLQFQIKQKSYFEFVPRDTSEFKSHQNLNSTLYREIPRNLIFSILTSWLKSPQHSGFRFAFLSPFWVSSSRERAVHSLYNRLSRDCYVMCICQWFVYMFDCVTVSSVNYWRTLA